MDAVPTLAKASNDELNVNTGLRHCLVNDLHDMR
jgi:hypothetical protein